MKKIAFIILAGTIIFLSACEGSKRCPAYDSITIEKIEKSVSEVFDLTK
jgi:hypothetical protein